ncbi:dihydropteroate synthase [Nesterenkonia flava]|uniref:Dihydropteroate synthase n=1 Tax=Nesterenkonia flava TaxID=469799 RepID=A0ABU1FU49_9MICC|nr:dihydropteroate synthase [Nesterenkonia flava]MDR5712191.1 dihydropteroate synthase [Nesterenkonia flava]
MTQSAEATPGTAGLRPRTLVMGILNVTPDSFSDGGQHDDVDSALDHARRLLAEGADIIDIGGESTRPGADPVSPQDEQRRILPVLEQLLALGVRLSVDTRHPQTARAALQLAGPRAPELIINDVSGLLTHPEMPAVIAEFSTNEAGPEIVITHNRGDSRTMQQRTDYADVVAEVLDELMEIRQRYLAAGVPQERIILDPGIGFSKTHEQNWELIKHLHRFTATGHRCLLGVSRKGFLGAVLAADGVQGEPERRDVLTAMLSAQAAETGFWAVRVHHVQLNRDAVTYASFTGAAPRP